MDKRVLLTKLQDLYSVPELQGGFPSRDACLNWCNRVAPLLQYVNQQYWVNFITESHRLSFPISNYTAEPTFRLAVNQLEMAIEELKFKIEMEVGLQEQMYFPEGSFLDIQKSIARVIQQATKQLWVCDGYMDEKIVEELTEVAATEIRLLTHTVKGVFQQRASAFRSQFPTKTLEIRRASFSHDRFYIIDDDQVWTLGASYNQAGRKATLLSKVIAEAEKQKIKASFQSWWNSGIRIC